MEVDDIIQAFGTGPNFTAGVTETLSVTREAGHAIGNGADGNSEIEGSEPDWQLPRRVGASGRGQRMSFKTAVLLGVAALWCVPCLAKRKAQMSGGACTRSNSKIRRSLNACSFLIAVKPEHIEKKQSYA
jgi:hypothetical protein